MARRWSTDEMPFDVTNRMLDQVLTDLSDDPALHVIMKGMPQVCERARGRYNDKRGDLSFTHQLFQRSSAVFRKAVLLKIVPIGGRHLTAARNL
jgi:hypothetical protein